MEQGLRESPSLYLKMLEFGFLYMRHDKNQHHNYHYILHLVPHDLIPMLDLLDYSQEMNYSSLIHTSLDTTLQRFLPYRKYPIRLAIFVRPHGSWNCYYSNTMLLH